MAESNALKLDKWHLDDPMWIVECGVPKGSPSIGIVATPDDAPGIAVIIDDNDAGLFGEIQGDAIHLRPHLVQRLLSRAVRAVNESVTCDAQESELTQEDYD